MMRWSVVAIEPRASSIWPVDQRDALVAQLLDVAYLGVAGEQVGIAAGARRARWPSSARRLGLRPGLAGAEIAHRDTLRVELLVGLFRVFGRNGVAVMDNTILVHPFVGLGASLAERA